MTTIYIYMQHCQLCNAIYNYMGLSTKTLWVSTAVYRELRRGRTSLVPSKLLPRHLKDLLCGFLLEFLFVLDPLELLLEYFLVRLCALKPLRVGVRVPRPSALGPPASTEGDRTVTDR